MIEDRRAFFRQGLSDFYVPLYDRLCQLLPEEWMPEAGFRTFKGQDMIFEQGRTQNADGVWVVTDKKIIVTDARGGESPHCYGCATDWTIFNGHEPVWMKKNDPRWQVYLDAVAQAKLKSGHDFSWDDISHNELRIAIDWRDVRKEFLMGGMPAANAAIYAAILME